MLGIIISLNPLVPPVNRLPPPRRVFDRDGNGFITRDELQTAMEMIGEPLNEQQLEQLLVIADLDQDGRINYEGECNSNSNSSKPQPQPQTKDMGEGTKDTADAGVRMEGHVCIGRN